MNSPLLSESRLPSRNPGCSLRGKGTGPQEGCYRHRGGPYRGPDRISRPGLFEGVFGPPGPGRLFKCRTAPAPRPLQGSTDPSEGGSGDPWTPTCGYPPPLSRREVTAKQKSICHLCISRSNRNFYIHRSLIYVPEHTINFRTVTVSVPTETNSTHIPLCRPPVTPLHSRLRL